jgi:excinuclease ABC subunit C
MPRVPFDRESIARIPEEPGVYQFLDEGGKVVYVGKAQGLRSRVRAYLNQTDKRAFVGPIVSCARSVEFAATGSVKDALLLENNLIKQHAPRFNIRLRDDKTYFSLKLDLDAEWPRLVIVRRRKKEKGLVFGPYTSAQACRRTIQYLNSLFPIRTCPDSVLYNRTRPCLSHEIGRCVAPCVGLTTPADYRAILDRVVRFLSGHDREVLSEVEAEMKAAAQRMDYERAAELRDRLAAMRETVERPIVARRGGRDRDVIGVSDLGDEVAIAVLHVQDGVLAHADNFAVKKLGEPAGILGAFLGQYYSGDRPVPPEILLPAECDDLDLYREILRERGAGVELVIPERGEGLRLVRVAERNAELAWRERADDAEASIDVLDRLQEAVRLVHAPKRIECYDISHLGGADVVGSGVSFVLGKPAKALYRHYRLRDVQRNDDFAALEEVLRRRLRRGLDEGDLPDLLIVDGGRPQVARAMQVFRELKVSGVDLVGLAKARDGDPVARKPTSFERVVLADSEDPVILRPDSPELLLLMRIRDEAHRFAIQYGRRLRRKQAVSSVLELVPGIGTRRARAILQHFGSLAAVKAASRDQLQEVSGMSSTAAEAVVRYFADHRDAGVDRGPTPPAGA